MSTELLGHATTWCGYMVIIAFLIIWFITCFLVTLEEAHQNYEGLQLTFMEEVIAFSLIIFHQLLRCPQPSVPSENLSFSQCPMLLKKWMDYTIKAQVLSLWMARVCELYQFGMNGTSLWVCIYLDNGLFTNLWLTIFWILVWIILACEFCGTATAVMLHWLKESDW